MRPDQSVKFAFGWLCARLIGLAALVVVAHGLLLRWAPALAGEQPLALVNIAITVCHFLIGLIFVVPAMTRRRLRRRQRWFARLLQAIIVTLLVALVLKNAVVAASELFQLSEESFIYAIAVAFIVFANMFTAFVFPGHYAAHLAVQYWHMKNAVASSRTEHDRASPHWEADDQTADWRARIIARHSEQAAAAPHRAAKAAFSLGELLNPAILICMLGLVMAAIGIYGSREAHFLPDNPHMQWSLSVQWWIMIGMPVAAAVLSIAYPPNETSLGPTPRFITVCILAGILWGVAAVSAIPHGLPALHSLLVKGVPTTLQVSIVEIGGEINRRRCNRILHVRGSADFDSGTRMICDVPRQIWESARIGQTLTLVGHRSPYGLRYDEIRR